MAVKDLYIGKQIKDYLVTEKIGGGTFGAVYRADHIRLPRSFAIKILHPHISNDETVVRRFKREAETLSMLQHPNVLQIIDFDWNDDIGYYLVTEFLNGEPLNELLRRKVRCSLDETVLLFSQLLSGLAQAHDKGVVHRDLKPANLMILLNEEQLTLKILDFGIATLGDQMEMTQTGTALGSAKYMSPEQVKGEIRAIDHRSDLYSAGIIFGKMVTGRDIFTASSPPEIFWKHVFEAPPPLSKLYPEGSFSAELEAVFQQSIAKEKDHRFQSARQFLEALERAAASTRRGNSTTTEASVARAFNPFLTGQAAVHAGQAEPSLDPRTGYPLPTSQSFSGSHSSGSHYPASPGTGAQAAFHPYGNPSTTPATGISATGARPAFVPHTAATPAAGIPGLSSTQSRPGFSPYAQAPQAPSPYGTPAAGHPPMGLSPTGARPALVSPPLGPSPARPSLTHLPSVGIPAAPAPLPVALPVAMPSQKHSESTQSDLDTIRPPDWMLQNYIDDFKAKQEASKPPSQGGAFDFDDASDETSVENNIAKRLPSKATTSAHSASPLSAIPLPLSPASIPSTGGHRPFAASTSGSYPAAPSSKPEPSPSSAILPSLNRLRSTGSYSIDQLGGPNSPLTIGAQLLSSASPEGSYRPRKMDLGSLEKEISAPAEKKEPPPPPPREKKPLSPLFLGLSSVFLLVLLLGLAYVFVWREAPPSPPPPVKRAQWIGGSPPLTPPPPSRRPAESLELPITSVCLPSVQSQAFKAASDTTQLLLLPDPALLLAFSPSETLHVLQRSDGQLRQTIALPAKATTAVVSKTASLVAVGLTTGSVLLLDLTTFALKLELQAHTQAVRSAAFSSDGKLLATASSEPSIKIWATSEDKPKQISKPQTLPYRTLLWGRDPRFLFFSLEKDKRLFSWDLQNDLLLTKDAEAIITSLALHPHERIVATGLADGSIKLWEMQTGQMARHIPKAHEKAIRLLAFHPSGFLLASASSLPHVTFWQTLTGDFAKQLKLEKETLHSFTFLEDGDQFLTTSEERQSSFWTCSCQDGQRRPCYPSLEGCRPTEKGFQCLGLCQAGAQVCQKGLWSSCQGHITPLQEVCNSKDDDCDGKVDEDKTCAEEPSERKEDETPAERTPEDTPAKQEKAPLKRKRLRKAAPLKRQEKAQGIPRDPSEAPSKEDAPPKEAKASPKGRKGSKRLKPAPRREGSQTPEAPPQRGPESPRESGPSQPR